MEQAVSGYELWRALAALILAATALMGSPGPATISVTASGAAFGLRRAAPYCAGVACGTLAVLVAVAAGTTSLLQAIPQLAPFLLAASLVYILHLAFRIARAAPLSAPGCDIKPPSFGGGLLLGISNPKAYLAIAAVFSSSTLPIAPPAAEAMAKAAVLGIMVVLIHAAWLYLGASLARLLRDPVSARIVNLILAAALIVSTVVTLTGRSPDQ